MPLDADTVAADRHQLCRFVATSRSRLHALLQQLQWSEAGVRADHRSAEKAASVAADELPDSCCLNPAFSVQLDEAARRQILGTDADQAGASQRLLLYEHVLQRTARHPVFADDNVAFAEWVGVAKRDQQKRRRHRKSKPTLNEELRQLLELQMEALQRQRAETAARELEALRSQKRRRSRSRSHERHRHRRPGKRERERERERERYRQHHRKHRSRSRSRSSHRRKDHRQHRSRDRY